MELLCPPSLPGCLNLTRESTVEKNIIGGEMLYIHFYPQKNHLNPKLPEGKSRMYIINVFNNW